MVLQDRVLTAVESWTNLTHRSALSSSAPTNKAIKPCTSPPSCRITCGNIRGGSSILKTLKHMTGLAHRRGVRQKPCAAFQPLLQLQTPGRFCWSPSQASGLNPALELTGGASSARPFPSVESPISAPSQCHQITSCSAPFPCFLSLLLAWFWTYSARRAFFHTSPSWFLRPHHTEHFPGPAKSPQSTLLIPG